MCLNYLTSNFEPKRRLF